MAIFGLSFLDISRTHMVFETFVIAVLFGTLYFEVFLFVTYLEHHSDFFGTRAPKRTSNPPTVTIIIPAWNEEKTLGGTVRSLLNLDYPKKLLSIVIVDDGSTDKTYEAALTFDNRPNVSVIRKENGGKFTALNLALEQTTSELVGCLDADSFVDRDALREIIPYFDDPSVMAVTPSVQIWNPENPLQGLQAIEYMIGEFTRKIFAKIGGLYVTPGPFSIYRRSVFEQIGGFVYGYQTEDMEMAMRMQSHRMRIENAQRAVVYTVSPRTARALYTQRVRWVTGFLKNTIFTYRHLLFSPRYGNLGMLTLPFALISIFVALFFTGLYLGEIGRTLYTMYLRYATLGFHPHFDLTRLDWFALNLEFSRIVIYLLFAFTLAFIVLGVMIVLKRFVLKRQIFYFLALYGFIAPIWLAKSVINLLVAKDAPWR